MPNHNPNQPPSQNLCLPCQKEELCGFQAQALISIAHSRMMRGELRGEELEEWNTILDAFLSEAKPHLGMT